ncbi:MAG: sel1 repeat family protein [Alphaproteobacteria bacterium]|nr:sel1 repeat family protein [Alphaproteobacteria bacterium]
MDESPKKKKGFSGFEDLGSDLSIEAPKPRDASKAAGEDYQNVIHEEGDKLVTKSNNNKRWLGAIGIIVVIVIALDIVIADNSKKQATVMDPSDNSISTIDTNSTYPPLQTYQPEPEPELAYQVTFTDTGSYNPQITAYHHTSDYIDYMEKNKAGQIKDYKTEYKKFFQLASAGSLDAMYIQGILEMTGKGIEKDEKQAWIHLYVAAMNGQPDAAFIAGLTNDKDPINFKFIRQAALQGNSDGAVVLGDAYLTGSNGMPKDTNKALFWYQKAASQHNPKGEIALSKLYYIGNGVNKDEKQAFAWAMLAAKRYDAEACAFVAALYADGGKAIPQNYGKASYWLTCADKTNPKVQNIQTLVESRMQRNDYITAAQLGLRSAMLKLAKDYHFGVDVQKNNIEARKYMQMYGFTEEAEVNSLKSSIQNQMTPEDIEKSDTAANIWIIKWIKDAKDISAVPQPVTWDPTYDSGEVMPSIGLYPELNIKELRWCTYQNKRLEFINAQFSQNETEDDIIATENAKAITPEISNNFDKMVNDTNSHCPNGRQYLESDMRLIQQELTDPIYLSQITLEAMRIMRGWSQNLVFKGIQ